MEKYTDNDQVKLMRDFPRYYAEVVSRTHMDRVSVRGMASSSQDGVLLAEFLAADGMTGVDLSSLGKAVSFVDGYLLSGAFDARRFERLMTELEARDAPMRQILLDYKEARFKKYDGAVAPVLLHVYDYARNLLRTCELIEERFAGEHKMQTLQMMAMCRSDRPGPQPEPL